MRSAADHSTIAEPDMTLVLDRDGVIEKATLSPAIAEETVESWVGRHWADIVGAAGGDKVRQIVEDALSAGVSAFRQINQPFPSGLELPFEFTAVRLENKRGLVAVGKNLKAVAELQTRLIAAQQLMERDYWRLREVESRYRLLFDASNEPVVLINATSLQIVEANPAAVRVFGLPMNRRGRTQDKDFMQLAPERDRPAILGMFERVRELGRAPGIMLHLGEAGEAWIVRASLTSADAASEIVLQCAPASAQARDASHETALRVDALIELSPDALVVVDRDGEIQRANRAFLELVGANARGAVLGEPLARWLSQPGADAGTLIANIARHQFVRLLPTLVTNDRGAERRVEISAAGDRDADPQFILFAIRDVERRIPMGAPANELGDLLRTIADRIGKAPLRQVVQETVDIVERHHIKAALDMSGGNRTAAAEILGLSRQSLYAKLNRYGIVSEG